MGLAAAAVRQPVDQVVQGEKARGAGNHRPPEQSGHQPAQLRDPAQAEARDVQAGGAPEERARHRDVRAGRRTANRIRVQPEECGPVRSPVETDTHFDLFLYF